MNPQAYSQKAGNSKTILQPTLLWVLCYWKEKKEKEKNTDSLTCTFRVSHTVHEGWNAVNMTLVDNLGEHIK